MRDGDSSSTPQTPSIDSICAPILQHNGDPIVNSLTCYICHQIPLEPMTTACEHLFCVSCIADSNTNECPEDHTLINKDEVKPLSGFARRLWEKVGVRCGRKGCPWNGCVGNYLAHALICQDMLASHSIRQIEELKAELMVCQTIINGKELENSLLERELLRTHTELRKAKEEIESLKVDVETVQAQQDAKVLTVDPQYKYNRDRIVELAQLICRDLDEKPEDIDSNRLYNCINNIHEDYVNRSNDLPEFFHQDFRMLLSICDSAGIEWFSERQLSNIEKWLIDL